MGLLFMGGIIVADFQTIGVGPAVFALFPIFFYSLFAPFILPWSSAAAITLILAASIAIALRRIFLLMFWIAVGTAIGGVVAQIMRWEMNGFGLAPIGPYLDITAIISGILVMMLSRKLILEIGS